MNKPYYILNKDEFINILNLFHAYGFDFKENELQEFGLLVLIDKVIGDMSKENYDFKYKLSKFEGE